MNDSIKITERFINFSGELSVRVTFTEDLASDLLSAVLGEWFHFVIIINGTRASDGISYYINGMKMDPALQEPRSSLTIEPGTGILSNHPTNYPVLIDELCFWNTTLDDQEIEDLYNSYGNNI